MAIWDVQVGRSQPISDMFRRLHPDDVIADRWIFVRRRSTFWNWLEVRDRETNEVAMCHLASDRVIRFLPEYRLRALMIKELTMLGASCVPEFIDYVSVKTADSTQYCLVVKPFGVSLERLRNRLNMIHHGQSARFSTATSLHIGLETLRALKEFHDTGYLYRPIEPSAFYMSRSSFVLVPLRARRWRNFGHPETKPLPFRSPLQSTYDGQRRSVPPHWRYPLRYASINVLRGNEPTRVDQLWSWFYMLFDLTLGSHSSNWLSDPWIYLTTISRIIEGKEAKHKRPIEWLEPAPPEYVQLFGYLRSLSPSDEPDYGRLSKPLTKALRRETAERNGGRVLDWEPGGQYYDILRQVVEEV